VRILHILIFLLFVSIAQAQIKKSIEVNIPLDTMSIVQDMDDSSIKPFGPPINRIAIDSLRSDTIVKPLMLYIERSMLDSLLKPYYNIQIDTNYEESNKTRIVIVPKYRMSVNSQTSDTSYIAIPKTIDRGRIKRNGA